MMFTRSTRVPFSTALRSTARPPASRPSGLVGQGVLDLHRAAHGGESVLEDPETLVPTVDAVGSLERAVLDVHVESRRPEHRDDRGVPVGDLLGVGARIADLASRVVGRVAAERRDDVAAHPAERRRRRRRAAGWRRRRSPSRRSSRARTTRSRSSRGTRAVMCRAPEARAIDATRVAGVQLHVRGEDVGRQRRPGRQAEHARRGARGVARSGRGLGDVGGAVNASIGSWRRGRGRRRHGLDGTGAGRQGARREREGDDQVAEARAPHRLMLRPAIRGSLGDTSGMKIRVLIQGAGKTAAGIEIPPDVVAALGAGKKPPVRVTIGEHTYRSTVATMNGVVHGRGEQREPGEGGRRGRRRGGRRHRARHRAARGDGAAGAPGGARCRPRRGGVLRTLSYSNRLAARPSRGRGNVRSQRSAPETAAPW